MLRIGWIGVAALILCGCSSPRLVFRSEARAPEDIGRWYAETIGDTNCVVALSTGACHGDPHAVFRMASLTKLFMMLAADDLEKSGRLHPDEPLGDFRRFGLPEEYASVTLRDLLEHRSGLPRELLNPENPVDVMWAVTCGLHDCDFYRGVETKEDILWALNSPHWRKAIRERRSRYSNVGFGLAWEIIAGRLKTDYRTIFNDRVKRRYRLDDTSFDRADLKSKRVLPLEAGDIPWLERRGSSIEEHELGEWYMPVGGLYSSACDSQKMAAQYWRLIDAAMARPKAARLKDGDFVAGLSVRVLKDGSICLYRSGMIYGGASFIGFDLKTRRVAVILRNQTCWPDNVGLRLMEYLHGGDLL